jgi:hypothetical protein
MVDTTTTAISIDDPLLISESETLSPSLSPLNISRHDSRTEINNYYINYIDDASLVQSDLKSLAIKENVYQLEVSQLPEEVLKFNLIKMK